MRFSVLLGMVLAGIAAPVRAADTPPAPASAHAPAAGLNLGKHDSSAPINITSDNFVGDFQTKVGTYTGNVIVTQADYKLRADTVKVNTLKGNPSRFDAIGHVVFVSDTDAETATGDNGVYDLGPHTVTLTGNVVLTKQKDVMRGTLLVVNMDTHEARLTAHGSPGGRVQGLFIPAQHPPGAGDKKPTSNSGK
jgi:lipopolysaccharide export system protein LptA